MNIIFKTIPKEDEKQLRKLIDVVLRGLDRKEYFIPYEEWEYEKMFDENYAPLLGAYDGNKLVAMAQLYVDQEMLKEFKEVLGISDKMVCELGGNLVLLEYRGQGLMFQMIKIQYEKAKNMKFDYIISMAHPDNIGSLKSLEKLGLKYVNTSTVANGHLRNIYIKKFD